MNLNHLTLFVQVAEKGSFTAAARELGVERSSVSRGVAALERDLGVQLFNRSTRSVALTSAGSALYESIAGPLATLTGALEDLPEREDDPSGQLRVTVPYDLGTSVFPQVAAGFTRRYPRVQLDVRLTNRVVDLIGEGFDAALRPGPATLPDSSLRARRLCAGVVRIYGSPSYLARAGTPRSMEELLGHDWVMGAKSIRPSFLDGVTASLIGDDMVFIRTALLEHLGLGLLPSFLAQEDVLSGRLVELPMPGPEEPFFLYLLTPASEHVPHKLRVFRDHVVEYFRARPLHTA